MQKCKSLLATAIIFLALQGFGQENGNRFEVGTVIATHTNYLMEDDHNAENIFGHAQPALSLYGQYRLGELGYSTVSLKMEAGMRNYAAKTFLGFPSIPTTIYEDFLFTNLLLNFRSEIVPNAVYFSIDIGGSSSYLVNQQLFRLANELPQPEISFAEYIKAGMALGFFGELHPHENMVLKVGFHSTTDIGNFKASDKVNSFHYAGIGGSFSVGARF